MELNWYAVYTRARWEKKVADQLNRIAIENYCPLNRVEKQWSDRKKIVEEPLFTSYVFVRVSKQQMNLVRELYGIVNFVCWLGKPAVIPDPEIQSIKQFLSLYQNVKIKPVSLNVQDRIKILQGPFSEMEGQVIAVSKRSVKVMLPSLRCFMTVEIEKDKVNFVRKYGSSFG
ncbi:UpxY family transcription antiterminator [Pedobacter immunditicola]|uniref:UpxY family transcription antiterminator n=1 Tax=Pedobacter immunditicola TaxID=3133440 RepID=UPI00309C2349